MNTRQSIVLIAALLGFVCCKTESVEPEVSFDFSAAASKYASLKGTVTVSVENPGKATFNVDWGDGSKDSGNGTELAHKYTTAGKYTVKANLNSSTEEWGIEIGSIPALDEALEDLYNTPGKVWVMAHRSHTTDRDIPENSVSAVRAAIKAGADVIETDTHRTKDGKVVISHDESIDKHTNGTGKITGMTLQELQKFNLTDRGGSVTSEVIPTLEDFLLAARGKAYVNLDYAHGTASTSEVFKIVEKLGMEQEVFMYCSDSTYVKDVFRTNPEANAYTRSEDWKSLLAGPNRYFLQVGWNSGQNKNSECVIRCQEAYGRGVLCSVNLLNVNHSYIPEYTIDSSQLSSLFDLYPECQMIQTDCPQEMITILKRQGRR